MVETAEIIVSALILFFVLLGIFYRFLKGKIILPVSVKMSLGKVTSKLRINRKIRLSLKTVVMAIVFVIILAWVLYGLTETPDKAYGSDELLQNKITGDCIVSDGEFVCNGPWSILIPGTQNIGKMKIYPGEGFRNLSEDIKIQSGPYLIKLWQDYINCDNWPVGSARYKAGVWYSAKVDYVCHDVSVSQDLTKQEQSSLYIGTPFYRAIPFFGTQNPEIYIGDDKIARSTMKANPQVLFGGNISISSELSFTRIRKIEIIYQ